MRSTTKVITLLACAAIGFTLGPIVAEEQRLGQPGASEKDAEVKVTIRVADPQNAASLRFYVTFENVGATDTVLNLGMMLANGRVQQPSAVRLALTDPNGRVRELQFSDKRYPGVAGRVDDYVVPLRTGSAYMVKLSLENFWCPKTSEFTLQLKPGKYAVRAEFTGQEAQIVSLGNKDVKFLPFWTGTVKSDAAQFDIAR